MWTPTIVSYTQTKPNQFAMAVKYMSDNGREADFTHYVGDDFTADQTQNQARVAEIMSLKCAELQGIDDAAAAKQAQADAVAAFLANPFPVDTPLDLAAIVAQAAVQPTPPVPIIP